MPLRLAIVVVCAAVCATAASATRRPARPLLLFVVAGQSNAAGFGALEKSQTPNPRVLDMLHPDGPRPAIDLLFGMGGERQPGSGFGRFFGNYLVRHARVRVGLIDCGVGGVPLASWLPSPTPQSKQTWTLYNGCLWWIRLVLERNPHAEVAGVLWSQGETDAERRNLASTWKARFELFATAIRRDLDAPRLPIVMQRTLDFEHLPGGHLPFTSEIRQQQELAAATIPGVALVNADGLPHKGEHFTAGGYSVLGGRMAEAWLSTRYAAALLDAAPS